MVTGQDILTTGGRYANRPIDYPPDHTTEVNAAILAARVARLFEEYRKATGKQLSAKDFTSGYRPAAINAKVQGAAPKSNHQYGCAVDVADADGAFDKWCYENTSILAICGLWLEHPDSTNGWTHLQCVPPRSRARVFRV